MDKVEKVKRFSELFELVQYYHEYRDQPMDESFNFEAKVQACCNALDLDFAEFAKEFNLQPY